MCGNCSKSSKGPLHTVLDTEKVPSLLAGVILSEKLTPSPFNMNLVSQILY